MIKNIIIVVLTILLFVVSIMYFIQGTMYENAKCSAAELLEITKIDYRYINIMNNIINNRNTVKEVQKELLALRAKRSQLLNSSKCNGDVVRSNVYDENGNVNITTLIESVNNKNIDAIMELFTPKTIKCVELPKSKTGVDLPWEVCKGIEIGQEVNAYGIGVYESSAGDFVNDIKLKAVIAGAMAGRFFKLDYEVENMVVLVSIDKPEEKIVFVSPSSTERKSFSDFYYQGFNPIEPK
jgi:hypothetical protein